MTAGDAREPPQSTASWASPVFLLFSVGVALWALVSGQGRAASAKLKALAARAPATIGTWLKRNKCDTDDTERAVSEWKVLVALEIPARYRAGDTCNMYIYRTIYYFTI